MFRSRPAAATRRRTARRERPMATDPRTVQPEKICTRLRDGSVDPRLGDFLGPTDAGANVELGNLLIPPVVNAEFHASQGVLTVRPCAEASDPAVQSPVV